MYSITSSLATFIHLFMIRLFKSLFFFENFLWREKYSFEIYFRTIWQDSNSLVYTWSMFLRAHSIVLGGKERLYKVYTTNI